MVRAISLLGMGGVFLMISPKLRWTLTGGMESVAHQMELTAPYSYIGGGALLLVVLVFSMYRGAQPR